MHWEILSWVSEETFTKSVLVKLRNTSYIKELLQGLLVFLTTWVLQFCPSFTGYDNIILSK